jgi:AraC family transcriptional regulator, ethanolamine operon transcriptional activator
MTFIQHITTEDFDELTESIRDWELDLVLLQPGKFQGKFLQCSVNGVIFCEGISNKNIIQQGGSPPGMRSLLFGAKPQAKFQWRGQNLTGEHVMTLSGAANFHKTVPSGVQTFNLAFSDEHAESLADELGVPVSENLFSQNDAFRCDPQILSTIISDVKRLSTTLKVTPEKIHDCRVQQLISRELPIRFLKLLSRNRPIRVTVSGRKRVRTLRLVESFLEVAAPDKMTVQALREATDVSERTLQYVLRDALGITPHAYLRSLRLHRVYRDLKKANPAKGKVADVANYWGFWHMGQFAKDYRKLFTELPSQTLAKKK